MKNLYSILCCLYSMCAVAQDARSIVQRADEKIRGKSSHVRMSIQTIRPEWTRSMEIEAWMKGTDLSLIRILAPAKEKGIIFLKKEKEVWVWYPALERSIRLPPSMMSQSWMGTDFTNDDLVKESSILRDYDHRITGDTLIDKRACYIIEMIPLPETAVVWSKVIVCIDKKDFMELHSRFYDEEGLLVNSMNGYEVQMMSQRLIPTRFAMMPADKTDHRTEMKYQQIEFDPVIPDAFFSLETMRVMP
ncbi:MAG: outer membrane lipoprotein-sorting protein [Bacteroidetes bacterium]|nr:outer membrane lipoprotein-sorting protein [Bacteroidota bacterium]